MDRSLRAGPKSYAPVGERKPLREKDQPAATQPGPKLGARAKSATSIDSSTAKVIGCISAGRQVRCSCRARWGASGALSPDFGMTRNPLQRD